MYSRVGVTCLPPSDLELGWWQLIARFSRPALHVRLSPGVPSLRESDSTR
jgi:hypothetical protein